MEKVLVAGGAGFIGSHLCDSLIASGYFVICVDSLITGSEKNIEQLKDNSNFEFRKLDITTDKLDFNGVGYIFNLASPASPIDYQNHPEETALANSLGTINLLKLAVANKARFVMASTSEIYGDPKEHPQKETYWGNVNTFGPRSCYDESKRFSESIIYVYIHKYDLDARIARIFNTYGPRMQKDDGRVVSTFINQALLNNPMTVNGKGETTRSFCYVSDLVDGLTKLMFADGLKGEVINLGNPEEYQIIDFAKKIKEMTSSTSEIIFMPLPKDDPMQRKPDVTKARELLDWEPKVTVDEGLRKTIEYYKSFL
jgi:nucleoside-diphosphate-sugar epimerase